MSTTVIRHVIVRGTVQGVGFRAFVEDGTRSVRGLAGWVRNRRDGSVEAVLAGPVEEVDAALAALRKGPSSAKVTARSGERGGRDTSCASAWPARCSRCCGRV